MMTIKIDISEETWARMLTGRRVEGTLGYDLMTGRKDFRAYHRRSREPGYQSPSLTVYETESGRLYLTATRNHIHVSSKSALGRVRSAQSLLMQAKELTDYLKNSVIGN